MPHLDEGMLHAYLDNALGADAESHLRDCSECRAKLEEARLVKDGADAILTGIAPVEIAMPSFEELQARANSPERMGQQQEAGKAHGRLRSFNQLRSIAWAATVVLAVAVGWYARSAILDTSQSRQATEGEASGRLTIPVPETVGAATNTPEDTEEAGPRMVRGEELESVVELDEASEGFAAPEVVGGIAIAADREETPETRRTSTSEPPEPPADRRVEPEVSAPPAQATRSVTSAVSAVGATTELRVEQAELQPRARMSPQMSDLRGASDPTVALTAGGRGETAEIIWSSVDQTTAESILDGPVPTVEGLPVIDYSTSSLEGGRAIRVVQRLESGQHLEIVITPEAGADVPASAYIAAEAKKGMERIDSGGGTGPVNTVTVVENSLRIVLSGALTTDSLRVLAQILYAER